MYLNFKSKK